MIGSELHRAALEWVAKSVPVFPCVAGTKRPACPNGFKDATTDPAQIDAWWAVDDYNVAIYPGGAERAVLDVDPDKGGFDSLASLELCYGPLDTFTIATPSGGSHYHFAGTLPRNTVSKLGPGLDTRSIGGYVLVPPSRTERGAYRLVSDAPLSPVPDFLRSAVEAQRNVSTGPTVGLDKPVNVARFKHYASTYPAPLEGRNERGTALVGVAMDMGLSRDTAWPILVEEWGARCGVELDDKLFDCGLWFNRQNEGHPLALDGPTSEVFKLPEDMEVEYERFYPFTIDELRHRPSPDWLIKDIIRERSIGHFFGPTQNYKSYLVALLAMQVAKERPVLYAVGEGEDEFAHRISALETVMGKEHNLRLAVDVPVIGLEGDVLHFIEVVKRHKLEPALVIIDTLSVSMETLDESTAKDMNRFVAAMKLIRKELHCAVAAIHHTGKDIARGERGSSVLRAGVDFTGEIEGNEKHKVVKLTMRKQRGTELCKTPFAFEGKRVGTELAFQPMALADYDELVGGGASSADVGAALAGIGEADGVTTAVLAAMLRPPVPGERIEDQETALAQLTTQLKHRAKRDLFGYCAGEGAKLRWFIPARDAE